MTAGERAFEFMVGLVGTIAAVGIVVACIVGPLERHWEPDIAVGGYVVLVGVWLAVRGVYKALDRP